MFLARQFITAVCFGGITFLVLVRMAGSANMSGGMIFIYALVMTLLGFFFPQYSLSRKITSRQRMCANPYLMPSTC